MIVVVACCVLVAGSFRCLSFAGVRCVLCVGRCLVLSVCLFVDCCLLFVACCCFVVAVVRVCCLLFGA